MDASGRKAFWDTLCSLHTYDHESARKLIEVSPWPQELCRFRAVNENSLLQLQNNTHFFLPQIIMMILLIPSFSSTSRHCSRTVTL